jgi:hypothetical protein
MRYVRQETEEGDRGKGDRRNRGNTLKMHVVIFAYA